MRFIIIITSVLIFSYNISAAESQKSMPKHDWSFNGFFGTFDNSSIQRGFKVYREVCAGCHSMNLIYYRDLLDIGFSNTPFSCNVRISAVLPNLFSLKPLC